MVMTVDPLLVVIDLETTGLSPVNGANAVQPVQIGAVASIGGKQMLFNAYILPTIPIDPSASEVNGFFVKNGKLLRKRLKGEGEEILSSVSVKDGLQQFWTWLESLRGEGEGRNLLITAHNGGAFDFPILMANMTNHGVSIPSSLFGQVQCADTYKAFKKLFSERGEGGQSCKLETLLQKYHPLWRETQAHDGLKDARDLKDLLGWLGATMNLSPAEIVSKAGQHMSITVFSN